MRQELAEVSVLVKPNLTADVSLKTLFSYQNVHRIFSMQMISMLTKPSSATKKVELRLHLSKIQLITTTGTFGRRQL